MKGTDHSRESSLRCSFCGKGQKKGRKLLASAIDNPRSYICNECVAMCSAIIEDDEIESQYGGQSHLWLAHPLASELMEAVERWVREQSLSEDGSPERTDVRRIAICIMNDHQ